MSRYIEATYKLFIKNNDGLQLIEEAKEDKPLKFYTGENMLIDGYENKIVAYHDGDNYEFSVTKEDAYGEYDDSKIFDLDKANFTKNGVFDAEHVHKNAVIPLRDDNGNQFLGRVISIDDNYVRIDLNHPLAGFDLTFLGTVLTNREATREEIESLEQSRHQHHCCGGHCHHHHEGEGHCHDGKCNGEGECSCHHNEEGGCEGHCH